MDLPLTTIADFFLIIKKVKPKLSHIIQHVYTIHQGARDTKIKE